MVGNCVITKKINASNSKLNLMLKYIIYKFIIKFMLVNNIKILSKKFDTRLINIR